MLWNKVYVVGVGAEGMSGLTARAREILRDADLLIGVERLQAAIPEGKADRLVANPGTSEVLDRIETRLGESRIAVLASGDPGFFGIAKVLVRRLGKDRVEIVPHVSSVQLAFARIKESWEDATFLSVHGRSLDGIASIVRRSAKAALLTDGSNTPAKIARSLLAEGVDGYRAYLCEDLGGRDERIRELNLEQLAETESRSLNLLILLRKPGMVDGEEAGRYEAPGHWRHGIPDEEFHQRRPRQGLITRLEVRMTSLAKLDLKETSVVWDVGAGSGSVAIEAAMLARWGQVYAVERDGESVELIRQNRERFGASNLSVIHGAAPDVLEDLPSPDAVFIGGSGGRLASILDTVNQKLREGGRVVINAATLETAGTAMAGLRERDFTAEATLMQLSRSKELGGLTHFEALNPVFVVSGRRRPQGPTPTLNPDT